MGNSAHATDTKDALASAAITAGEAAIAAMRLCPWTCLACRAGRILGPRGGDAGHGHQRRIFHVGRLGEARAEFDLDLHTHRRTACLGATQRTRSREEIRAEYAAMRRDLWAAVEAGRCAIPIDRIFPLAEAAKALAFLKAKGQSRRIALAI